MKRDEFISSFRCIIDMVLDNLPDEAREIDYLHNVCMKLRHIEGAKIDDR